MNRLPRLRVELGGVALSPDDASSLGEVRVRKRLSEPASCELVFRDPQGALGSDPVTPGTPLGLTVQGAEGDLFAGEVAAVERTYGPAAARTVRVRARDRMERLRRRQAMRVHVEVTAHDLAGELVADLGVSVAGQSPGPLRRRIVQHRQSHLALLTETTADCGLYWTLQGDVLHLLTLEGRGEAIPLVLGRTLLEARIETRGAAAQAVTAVAWDPWRADTVRGHAAQAHSPQTSPGSEDPGERFLPDEVAQAGDEAEALAQADLDARRARDVVLVAVAEGDARLEPGAVVALEGVLEADRRFVLTDVEHVISETTGFVSRLGSAPPPPRRRPEGAVASLARVTRVDDPEGFGRVRVALPSYGDVETDWLQVVVPGAGPGKGLIALPDVEDKVLVLLARGDPAQGVVLGGLFGAIAPPDAGIEGGRVRRYTLRTPAGHLVQLDDAGATLRVQDSRGSRLELGPDRMQLHSVTDLEIEAPGRTLSLRAQKIDFERA